jgi:hypothetical protein
MDTKAKIHEIVQSIANTSRELIDDSFEPLIQLMNEWVKRLEEVSSSIAHLLEDQEGKDELDKRIESAAKIGHTFLN